jgi:hypothetical protein
MPAVMAKARTQIIFFIETSDSRHVLALYKEKVTRLGDLSN